MRIVLGSSSRWRRKVLEDSFGTAVETAHPDIDEKQYVSSDPSHKALMIASAKADALLNRATLFSSAESRNCLLITADQVVFCNSEIREKPEDEATARRFLRSYANGAPASTVSALVVSHPASGIQEKDVHISTIHFEPFGTEVDDQLVAEGDIYTCAGGFICEHPLLNPRIAKLEGSMDSIQGLPLETLFALIEKVKQRIAVA
eukprot:ANDGO_05346.mRNA.1 Maf-like protein DDB_G0281937